MPKIIDNLPEQIRQEAKKQIITNGYSKTTIRSVASGCNIGVGTLYNHFRSKDELIASFMLDDWRSCTARMRDADPSDKEGFLKGIQMALSEFIKSYEPLFNDEDAIRAFSGVFYQRHIQLRNMMAELIKPICVGSEIQDNMFLAQHIAESIISWSMEKVPFDKQYSIISKLL